MDDWVRYDLNTDPTTDNDCLDSGGSKSYYYHRDRNTRVVALTDEDGAVVERYEYDAYGNPTITIGDPGGALGFERGAVRHLSSVGNPFMHQGLFFSPTLRSYQNRFRQYHAELGRFMQRDPLGYVDGMSLYEYEQGNPVSWVDPLGMDVWVEGPNANEPGGHLSVNVGDPNGYYTSYSFGVNSRWSILLAWSNSNGEVYQDVELGGEIDSDRTRRQRLNRIRQCEGN